MRNECFWAKVLFREYLAHYIAMNDAEIVNDVKKSIIALTKLSETGESFGAKMVKWANERIDSNAAKASAANGSKGGRPRKNSPDTRGGSASPAGCAAGKRIPPQESTTAAGESADPKSDSPKEVSESSDAANRCFANPAESAAGKRTPRTAEGSAARSLPPSTAELYDFAEAARLSEADAREWWGLCTERGWKDRYGKPIRDWKKACERYCARRAINRMAKGET